MINFSKISNRSFLGVFLRSILKIIPKNITIRVLQGRLKGKKWIKGSGVNGYWLGTYELGKQKLFENKIKKGNIVFDIGAHVGFYSLLALEIVGSKGKVFSFEPLIENFNYLKKHIKINNYHNAFLFQVAVSDKNDSLFFRHGGNSLEGYITDKGEIKVKSITIDRLIDLRKLPIPDVVKIDVEGSELLVLNGMMNILKNNHPIIFLSTHSLEIHKKCFNLLSSFGYTLNLIPNSNDELIAYT